MDVDCCVAGSTCSSGKIVSARSPKSVVGSPATVFVGVPGASTAILSGRVVSVHEIRGIGLADAQDNEGVERGRNKSDVEIHAETYFDGARIRKPPRVWQLAGRERWPVIEQRKIEIVADRRNIQCKRCGELTSAVCVNQPDLAAAPAIPPVRERRTARDRLRRYDQQ